MPRNEQADALAAITAADDQTKAAMVLLARGSPAVMEKLHLAASSRDPARLRALDDNELIVIACAARIGITEVARAMLEQEQGQN